MMLFTLGAKIKNLIEAFKTRVLGAQGEFEAETCLDTQLTDLDNKGLLDSASFVLTPNAYEEGVLFAIKPDEIGNNLLLQSEDFNVSPWIFLQTPNVTITPNAGTSPIGTSNATLLTSNTTTIDRGIRQVVPIILNMQYVFSCWARSDNGAQIRLDIGDVNTTTFNLTTTWQRIEVVATPTVNGRVDITFGASQLGKTCLIWGAQLELGSTASNYTRTTTKAIDNGTIGDMSVIRATTATRVNADGDIEQVPYNLTQHSQNFENAVWSKGSAILTTNFDIAPDGSLTAAKYVPNSTNIRHDLSNFNLSFYNGKTITMSVYVKNAGNRYVIIGTIGTGIRFDFNTETITNLPGTAPLNSFVEVLPNGWYRIGCTISSLDGGRIAIVPSNIIINTTPAPFAGNDVDGVLVWGAQMVLGTQARDYFPTTTRLNVPRIDYSNSSCPSILVEQATTNFIRNNSMVGAAVGNPGTLPTNWSGGSIVSSLGVENGIEYIDIRIAITATSGFSRIFFEPSTQIVAANGQTWTLSSYLKIINAPQPPTGYRLRIFENTSTGALITSGFQTITPTTSFARYSFTRTLSGGATVARVQPILEFTTVSGQPYDFTVRVYGPQMQQLAFATSLIQTSTGAATKNADVIDNTNMSTLIGQTEGAMFVDFNYERFNPLADNFIATISDGIINNSLLIAVVGIGAFVVRLRTSGTTRWDFIIPAASFTFGRKKVVISYKSGETNLYVNGVKIGSTNTSAFTFPVTINKFNLGSSWSGSSLANNTINSAALYKTALTDAQAIQLTTL